MMVIMKIIKRGILPEDRKYKGKCDICGTEVTVYGNEVGVNLFVEAFKNGIPQISSFEKRTEIPKLAAITTDLGIIERGQRETNKLCPYCKEQKISVFPIGN